MTYIDKITIHNFKSFKHSTIKFSGGFTCIIGPNGSGKSNICDSLFFALGESSLRRMRAMSINNFINSSSSIKSNQQSANRTYVTAHLSGKDLSITRTIKYNNKIAYYLNNKRMTRQEVLDALKLNNSSINYTNTITQEEISRIINLNPKDRRSLIDIAAGIKEFDDKKDASLKQLGSVEEKISNSHIQLSERSGFLKELKKEKDDAELHIKLRDMIKSINYTILNRKELLINKEYKTAINEEIEVNDNTKTIKESIEKADLKILSLSKSRMELSNKLNEGSIELNKTNRELESLNKDLAVIESKMESSLSNNIKIKERLKLLQKERDSTKKTIDTDTANINKLKDDLASLNIKITSLGSDVKSGYDLQLFEKYESTKNSLAKNTLLMESINENIERAKLNMRDKETSKKYIEDALSITDSEYEKFKDEYKKIDITGSNSETSRLKGLLEEIHSKINNYKTEINNTDSKILGIRESIAVHGGDLDKITKILKGQLSGLFGRVYELCSYDNKYSYAVTVSSGARMNYFIVDTIETAKKAISILKSKNLGRSSFIPLSDIYVRSNKEILKPLINFIRYDKKLFKAISFVFSNTYLVDSIDEAKKYGFGFHKYVTIDGELIDPSGTITGGTLRIRTSITKLHSDLETYNQRKKDCQTKLSDLEIQSEEIRTNLGKIEVISLNTKLISENLHENITKSESIIKTEKEKIISIASDMSNISSKLLGLYSKKKELTDQNNGLENENQKLYEKISKIAGSSDNEKIKTQQKEKSKLQSESEKLNISIASFSKEKEVFTKRMYEFDDELNLLSKENDILKKDLDNMKLTHHSLLLKKQELAQIINSHDSTSSMLYKQVSEFENRISELSAEKGRFLSRKDSNEKLIIELKSTILQTSTRLADIKSELFEYSNVKETDGEVFHLESDLREYKSQIEKLGNVNLKAPEVYELKSRDVREAEEKIKILEREKTSIITMINEIESKKFSVFMRIFNSINKNFQYLYSQISDGEAILTLNNLKDPFSSGLSIKLKPIHGKHELIESKSGGEKSLLIILLMLSIQMQKPMSFYIFDEIDASLDKQNSKKLSMLLKSMSKKSQFIVVSHNDNLISNADTIIGVTKRNGESKVVGVQLLNKNQIQHT